jgi:hypothetical protein
MGMVAGPDGEVVGCWLLVAGWTATGVSVAEVVVEDASAALATGVVWAWWAAAGAGGRACMATWRP